MFKCLTQTKLDFNQRNPNRDLISALLQHKFIYAKTMPKFPHWYTLRKDWQDNTLFDFCVEEIRRCGYPQTFGGREYIYFNMNGFMYWTMGAPVEKTILINKAAIYNKVTYTDISCDYDSLFTDTFYIEQDKRVFDSLEIKAGDRILDVGCGTGLLYDLIQKNGISDVEYLGIDPCIEMLEIFSSKYPNVSVFCIRFEDFYPRFKPTKIISLYGSLNHIHPCSLPLILDRYRDYSPKVFFYFYQDTYYPKTYEKTGIELQHFKFSDFDLSSFEKPIVFDDYLFIRGKI